MIILNLDNKSKTPLYIQIYTEIKKLKNQNVISVKTEENINI